MTDYQRQPDRRRTPARAVGDGCGLVALLAAAGVAGGCSPRADAPPDDGPRPAMIVAGQLTQDEIVEASGLARSARQAGLFWSHNDNGSKPRLYALDDTGAHAGRVKLDEARNRDWEDIASFTLDGEPYLLVADVGDNDADRNKLTLYIVPEPDLAADDKVRLEPAWQVDFRYPDGPRDAEAVAVDAARERVIVLTKRDLPPQLYEVPLRPAGDDIVTATRLGPVESLPRPTRQALEEARFTKDWHWQPTGMDLSADGALAVILTYRAVYVYRRGAGEDVAETLSGRPYGLGLGNFRNAESVAFDAAGTAIFVTLEGRHPPLLRIDIKGAIPQ